LLLLVFSPSSSFKSQVFWRLLCQGRVTKHDWLWQCLWFAAAPPSLRSPLSMEALRHMVCQNKEYFTEEANPAR